MESLLLFVIGIFCFLGVLTGLLLWGLMPRRWITGLSMNILGIPSYKSLNNFGRFLFFVFYLSAVMLIVLAGLAHYYLN